jgi:hypothetical protein
MHRRPETTGSKHILRAENLLQEKVLDQKKSPKKTREAPGADDAKIGSLLLLPRSKKSNTIARPTYNRLVRHFLVQKAATRNSRVQHT